MNTEMQRLEELFDKYIHLSLSQEEERELSALLVQPSMAAARELLIERAYNSTSESFKLTREQSDAIFTAIIHPIVEEKKQIRNIGIKRLFLAASIFAAIAFGAYFIINNRTTVQQNDSNSSSITSNIKAPVTNKAMITLSNGQSIYLDSVSNGKLLQQNGIEIIKLADGKIAYTGTTTELLYNTLTNPRGSKVIDMALPDGSHVWLNASSSITFPLAFVGKERRVSITGEAYFEVAKNAAIPFRVEVAGKCEVSVLGTNFNVNAYADEASVNTTLLEGRVQVTAHSTLESKVLAPGQQAQLNANAQIIVQKNARIDEVMAWKNGYFNFENADLPTVMRKLQRWYDIDVVYEGVVPQRSFGGAIQNDLTLTQVLHILEKNNVYFKVNGNRLIIKN